uniref:UNC93-like protein n=1 Tax=Timema monikensis TaxID=170555 RepID=A0A7R9E502_9NEOP|nr:unnamed protein product [Timema monikensis]
MEEQANEETIWNKEHEDKHDTIMEEQANEEAIWNKEDSDATTKGSIESQEEARVTQPETDPTPGGMEKRPSTDSDAEEVIEYSAQVVSTDSSGEKKERTRYQVDIARDQDDDGVVERTGPDERMDTADGSRAATGDLDTATDRVSSGQVDGVAVLPIEAGEGSSDHEVSASEGNKSKDGEYPNTNQREYPPPGVSPGDLTENTSDEFVQQLQEGCQGVHCSASEGGGDPPGGMRRVLVDVVLISISFLLLLMAFTGISNLQSSVNAKDGLGVITLATMYSCNIVSLLLFSVGITRSLGCKWTMVASVTCVAPYVAAQMFLSRATLLAAAALAGFAMGPLMCALYTHLSLAAATYSRLSGVDLPKVIFQFLAVFYALSFMSEVGGNLISSTGRSVTSYPPQVGVSPPILHSASYSNISCAVSAQCGAQFCPGSDLVECNPNMARPPDSQIIELNSIYLGCVFTALIILAVWVNPLPRVDPLPRRVRSGWTLYQGESGQGGPSTKVSQARVDPLPRCPKEEQVLGDLQGANFLGVTTGMLKERKLLLLVPITMWLGMKKAFVVADFNAAYVSCSWGIGSVGYIMTSYGVANSVATLLTSHLVKMIGRTAVMYACVVILTAVLVTMLCWDLQLGQDHYVLFALMTSTGLAGGALILQVSAMFGVLFPGKEEAAYSNLMLWQAVGFVTSYGFSIALCTNTKIYILLFLLMLGTAGYLRVDRELKTSNKTYITRL